MHVDFGEKRREYLSLPDLDAYLVLAPDAPRAWVWQRDERRLWPDDPQILDGAGADVSIPSLGVVIRLTEIYRNVV